MLDKNGREIQVGDGLIGKLMDRGITKAQFAWVGEDKNGLFLQSADGTRKGDFTHPSFSSSDRREVILSIRVPSYSPYGFVPPNLARKIGKVLSDEFDSENSVSID